MVIRAVISPDDRHGEIDRWEMRSGEEKMPSEDAPLPRGIDWRSAPLNDERRMSNLRGCMVIVRVWASGIMLCGWCAWDEPVMSLGGEGMGGDGGRW